jgi:release factor glutamine methyltransferase
MAETWTVRSVLSWAREWLGRKSVDNPRLDAELLLAHALQCDRLRLYVDIDKPVTPQELGRFKPLIQRRAAREPVAYILAAKEFYGRPFEVAPGVFIPRPETELLVRIVLEGMEQGPRQVLDLCAGSGAVGVSVAAERAEVRVDLVELSPQASAVAQRNAERLAPGRARIFSGDLYAALPDQVRYDAIAANPPYVPIAQSRSLAPEIVDHEPHLALFAGADGLEVIRRMVSGLPDRLAPGGFFVTEIDPSQGKVVAGMLREAELGEVRVERDLAGLDRFVSGKGR